MDKFSKLRGKFGNKSFFFITTDIKRAIGLEDIIPDFHIICSNYDPLIPVLRNKGIRIYCLEELKGKKADHTNNSGLLISDESVEKYIRKNSSDRPYIVYFKPSLIIDRIISAKKYISVGNTLALNNRFENKINMALILKKIRPDYIQEFAVGKFNDLDFTDILRQFGLPLVVQFGHGWAGRTTFFIESEDGFIKLKKQFPHTTVKITANITGFTLLNNCCIYRDNILVSPPAIQIDGINKLSVSKSVTCGRSWPVQNLTGDLILQIYRISRDIGRIMSDSGYRGYFGVDFLVEISSGRLFLSEVNARLTASSAFFSLLEMGLDQIPLLAFHYASFLSIDLPVSGHPFISIHKDKSVSGSQVIIRRKDTINSMNIKKFGEYRIIGKSARLLNTDYAPQRLKKNRFIFLPRINGYGSEFARIESKDKALKKPGELAGWVKNLLGG